MSIVGASGIHGRQLTQFAGCSSTDLLRAHGDAIGDTPAWQIGLLT